MRAPRAGRAPIATTATGSPRAPRPRGPRGRGRASAPAARLRRRPAPRSRAARTRSQSACSAARYRGASSSWSKSRNATRRTGRDASAPARWSTRLGADRDVERRERRARRVDRDHPMPRRRARRRHRGRWSRRARSFRNSPAPQLRHTRGLDGIAPLAAMAAVAFDDARVARAHSAIVPQLRQTSRWARPRRFSTHSARPPAVERGVQRAAERRREQAGAGRLVAQVDDVEARPTRRARVGVGRRDDRVAGELDGLRRSAPGVTSESAAPARRARSATRSRACHAGARSSASASSASSSDDDAGEVGHRREHRDPAPDHDARAPPRVVPGRGPLRSRVIAANERPRAGLRPASAAASSVASPAIGHDHDRRSLGSTSARTRSIRGRAGGQTTSRTRASGIAQR